MADTPETPDTPEHEDELQEGAAEETAPSGGNVNCAENG